MPAGHHPRVLAASALDLSDWAQPQPEGSWSQFVTALARRFELAGVVAPEISRHEHYLNLARSFDPRRPRWKARAGFNPWIARRRSAALERELRAHRGTYDLVVQLQTLFAGAYEAPYVIYTDNTMALTQRFYPAWAPLAAPAARAWMDFEAAVCRRAAAVYTFSEFARSSVIEDYGVPEDRVLAAGAGANLIGEAPAAGDRPRALFVGIDFARKGGHVLLEAWPQVRARIPTAELVIAGPQAPPSSSLPAGIRWVGKQNRRELSRLYGEASVFVLASLFEPYGFVFLEAMGFGLPCIGTAHCAMPEIIEDGVTGRLVAPGEPEPLAGALIELLGDPARGSALGAEGRSRITSRYRWDDVVERVAEHLVRIGVPTN